MLISSPVFANLGRCLQTRGKALTKSVADIIPSSLFSVVSGGLYHPQQHISERREEERQELFSHCPTQAFTPSVGTLAPKQRIISLPLHVK